ncbi:CRISPR-associated helicase, Cas3 family [Bacteroides luti]|uniref:CRISPR-associated helicase, Cas3 family n=1 Tax=Bacteroides luti TaxID=1297750 RepID=A0A1M5DN52_9BACE|nr:CRISPR-associated helicase/endonuclease Cas3 [Bacteroides luti]SHF68304.1 CRISPR-associated helicase, Cas3 family [Bacteroides luti]
MINTNTTKIEQENPVIAHIKINDNGEFEIQKLEEHLVGTAEMAKQFCKEIDCYLWGYQIGIWHDIGKYNSYFQKYIKINSGYLGDEGTMNKTDHSSAGAIYAKECFPRIWQPLAYIISGHHSGLLNWDNELGITGDLQSRLQKKISEDIRLFLPDKYKQPLELPIPFDGKLNEKNIHLWIRMMFSCLVDSDYLDTERFMNPDSFYKRGHYSSIPDLKNKFDAYMESLNESASNTFVNTLRSEIYSACINSGESENGFFTLNVPTGGGKTLSSMGFSLTHAVKNSKKRIIVVIPYTSIIVQTAQTFRDIFGEENVIEHHSNLDNDKCSEEHKLAIENWDAPIIVTTNVQFFESLYSNRTSSCRKLHNIANSIIILDEAQMLPPEFLKPILSVLNELNKLFNVSVLFTTATLPVLTGKIGTGESTFKGIEAPVTNIIKNTDEIETCLKRVSIEMPEKNEQISYTDLAQELLNYNQVLCILNTRNECSELYKSMPTDTLHLSRMMCSAHIMNTIKEIKRKLLSSESVRVVSTQLIEAGVDMDFPVVYRVFAGLDSIAQAAGRCNREGKLNKEGKLGKVKVFYSEKGAPRGFIRKGADALTDLLYSNQSNDYLCSSTFRNYFIRFYSKINSFDKAKIKENLWDGAREMKFQFATAANNFRLIDDNGKSIIVWYNESTELIDLLKRKGPEPWLMRKLQQYSVSVRDADFIQLAKEGRIEKYHDIWVQADPYLYNTKVGLVRDNHWLNEIFIV